jgi:hypothetical protein
MFIAFDWEKSGSCCLWCGRSLVRVACGAEENLILITGLDVRIPRRNHVCQETSCDYKIGYILPWEKLTIQKTQQKLAEKGRTKKLTSEMVRTYWVARTVSQSDGTSCRCRTCNEKLHPMATSMSLVAHEQVLRNGSKAEKSLKQVDIESLQQRPHLFDQHHRVLREWKKKKEQED